MGEAEGPTLPCLCPSSQLHIQGSGVPDLTQISGGAAPPLWETVAALATPRPPGPLAWIHLPASTKCVPWKHSRSFLLARTGEGPA